MGRFYRVTLSPQRPVALVVIGDPPANAIFEFRVPPSAQRPIDVTICAPDDWSVQIDPAPLGAVLVDQPEPTAEETPKTAILPLRGALPAGADWDEPGIFPFPRRPAG